MSFGQNLLALRKEKYISQEELGSHINVSRQTISKWELDETTPEMEKLILLSEFFNVSLDELVKGKNSEYKVENHTRENTTATNNHVEKERTTSDILLLVLKFLGIAACALFLVDIVVMITYFVAKGFPSL